MFNHPFPKFLKRKHSNDILAWLEDNDFTDYSYHQNIILVKLLYIDSILLEIYVGHFKGRGALPSSTYMMGI